MISRALRGRRSVKNSPQREFSEYGESSRSQQDGGRMADAPLVFCDENSRVVTFREVLASSVAVLGESELGIVEKVVLVDGRVFAAKRLHRVSMSRIEFSRSVERLAQICSSCPYLVPIRAYIHTRRSRLLLCDYYAMGSLGDLLTGGRELGQTPLDWKKRLMIVADVARAIAFIHAQSPTGKQPEINVHGNIKASNVFIRTDFTACVSDYGFLQLVDPVENLNENPAGKLSQKSDIYSFGVLLLEILAGPKAVSQVNCVVEKMEEIKDGRREFFEFLAQGQTMKQALQVLDIAIACTNKSPEERPSVDQIVGVLCDILSTE